jgi:hypothetical protein
MRGSVVMLELSHVPGCTAPVQAVKKEKFFGYTWQTNVTSRSKVIVDPSRPGFSWADNERIRQIHP